MADETSRNLVRSGAVPDWRTSQHGEGKPPSPESAWPKIDRHLPNLNRDLQGNPAFGAGRTASEEALRPRTSIDTSQQPATSPKSRRSHPISDPKAAALAAIRPEGRTREGCWEPKLPRDRCSPVRP